MVRESIFIMMVAITMEIGLREKCKDKESYTIVMAI